MRFLKREDGDKGVKNVNEDDGLYWDVLGCNWALLSSNRLYWALLGCTGLYLAIVGCSGL